MKKICIIPARAGSKRIKNKNLKEMAGKPLIAWTIECAIDSGMFDEIILSTDSEEILDVGSAYGLPEVGLRPSSLSGDYATAADVIGHYVSKNDGSRLCYLQPTSPLRTSGDVISSYNLMENNNAYSVISVCEYDMPENWIYSSSEIFQAGAVKIMLLGMY